MEDLTFKIIDEAVKEYLEYSLTPPEQFNLRRYTDFDTGELKWEAEFHKDAGCWHEGFTTWLTGEKVIELFFSRDPKLVNLDGWQENWND